MTWGGTGVSVLVCSQEAALVSSFFYKISKQARVPTFVCLFRDDSTTGEGPGCDEGTNLRLRDFAVVPLVTTRVHDLYLVVLYILSLDINSF